MNITRMSIYRKNLSYASGAFAWGRGNVIESSSSTVVVIDTDTGMSGVGEFCPCGENYMVAHSEETEAAARLLAPRLLGEDTRQLLRIERLMEHTIIGHGYAKAAFDSACWDLLGKATNQPIWMLLGGKLTDGAPMYRSAPQGAAQQMAADLERLRGNGYRQSQIKVGNDWRDNVERFRPVVQMLEETEKAIADANQDWHMDEAIQVARAIRGLDYIIEQPCHSYEECLQVRRYFGQPMKLDECITDLRMADQAFETAGRFVQSQTHARLPDRTPHQGGRRGHLGQRNYSSTPPTCTATTKSGPGFRLPERPMASCVPVTPPVWAWKPILIRSVLRSLCTDGKHDRQQGISHSRVAAWMAQVTTANEALTKQRQFQRSQITRYSQASMGSFRTSETGPAIVNCTQQ
ncbi:mandelate racemase/muconate lactonizing enzyme family protein [Pseudomonas violetae]|uniref:glucarate dehydratase n=1 Tax=Pseudomonas violetae TaxID=2915813 RepID=A0ABT0ET04_9PSED|nr:mandelate racemase/muconate lactonizing enzyme family protein [Pseudomonas violetae]